MIISICLMCSSSGLPCRLRNYRILTARNGKQGIEILKSTRVDFVLTDLDMPEMDGYQFIEYCREAFSRRSGLCHVE